MDGHSLHHWLGIMVGVEEISQCNLFNVPCVHLFAAWHTTIICACTWGVLRIDVHNNYRVPLAIDTFQQHTCTIVGTRAYLHT